MVELYRSFYTCQYFIFLHMFFFVVTNLIYWKCIDYIGVMLCVKVIYLIYSLNRGMKYRKAKLRHYVEKSQHFSDVLYLVDDINSCLW